MTSAFSWQNSVSLFPASLCTLRSNLLGTLGVSWTSCFCILFPYDEKHVLSMSLCVCVPRYLSNKLGSEGEKFLYGYLCFRWE